MAAVQPTANPKRSYAMRLSYSFSQIPEMFWQAITTLTEGVFATAHDNIEDNKHVHLALWNCGISHDALRKRIVAMVKEYIEDSPPSGNALMSVKKWDGKEKYLIYMLKGDTHEVCHNSIPFTSTYIEYLRAQWDEYSDQKKAYNEWKTTDWWPTLPSQTEEEFLRSTGPPPQISFDTVRQKALQFSLSRYGGFVNAKVRYEVKDLVSNYCLFNNIKMGPLYI